MWVTRGSVGDEIYIHPLKSERVWWSGDGYSFKGGGRSTQGQWNRRAMEGRIWKEVGVSSIHQEKDHRLSVYCIGRMMQVRR